MGSVYNCYLDKSTLFLNTFEQQQAIIKNNIIEKMMINNNIILDIPSS